MIQLDKYIYTMKMWSKQIAAFRQCPDVIEGVCRNNDNGLNVFWGWITLPCAPSIVIEAGFFWQAAHLDTIGMYQQSSLCTPQALREIEKFNAPVPALDILEQSSHSSKYPQGEDLNVPDHWDKVVLASQNPYDRSIRAVGSPNDYFTFYENACKHYGKNLFIKLHPWNSGEVGDKLRKIAADNGVTAAKVNHRIIKNCQFVLVFNSTFSVDCMIRGVPVAQYAPGYFYQNPAVNYTNWKFPNKVSVDKDFGFKTCDFLMWRYCFDHSMPGEKWVEMFKQVAKSKEMFPIPEEFCYARNKMRA
jgi:hypothetical protein